MKGGPLGVVARLMGLDALPPKPKVVHRPQDMDSVENFLQDAAFPRRSNAPKRMQKKKVFVGQKKFEVEADADPQQTSSESQEIQETRSLLQSNKELIMKFLEEPESSKDGRDTFNDGNVTFENFEHSAQPCQELDAVRDNEAQGCSHKCSAQQRAHQSFGKSLSRKGGNYDFNKEVLGSNDIIPTRIVVLKPNSGIELQSLMSTEANTCSLHKMKQIVMALKDVQERLTEKSSRTISHAKRIDPDEVPGTDVIAKHLGEHLSRDLMDGWGDLNKRLSSNAGLRELVSKVEGTQELSACVGTCSGTKGHLEKTTDHKTDFVMPIQAHSYVVEKWGDFKARHGIDVSSDVEVQKLDGKVVIKGRSQESEAGKLRTLKFSSAWLDATPKRFIFGRKMLGWKGSLFGKHGSLKERMEETQYAINTCHPREEKRDQYEKNMLDRVITAHISDNSLCAGSLALRINEPDNVILRDIGNLKDPDPSLSSSLEKSFYMTVVETDCYASKANKEQCEQPSPVSVLDTVFQEEKTSLVNLEGINSGLKGLQERLEVLKFVGQELLMRTKDSAATIASKFTTTYNQSNHFGGKTCSQSCIGVSESFDNLLDGIDCPKERHGELQYVKDILIDMGFISDSISIFRRWYTPNQPLDPAIFASLEDGYRQQGSDLRGGRSMPDYHMRHHLFDMVNEVLLHVLGPHMKENLWCMLSGNGCLGQMPHGKSLLTRVWVGVSAQTQLGPQDSLESLIAKDLLRRDYWLDLRSDMEMVAAEIERSILDDVLDESLDFVMIASKNLW